MSPENDRDSQRFKLPHYGICLRNGSLKKPYRRAECGRGRMRRHWIHEVWSYR